MKYLFLFLFQFPIFVIAQKNDDTKIIITLNDNADIYKKIKVALVNADFIVKDNYNLDTLTTYAREFTSMPGHCIAIAVLKENTVTINGFYSLKKMDWFGYTQSSNSFQKVMYYKGSKSWDLLMKVAEAIGGQITFSR